VPDRPQASRRVEGALERARESQDELNAFTAFDDEASSRATRLDHEAFEGPLLGMPLAVKDLIAHEGRVTTCGSAFYRHLATSTAPCIARMERAGSVVVGRTGLHEWAFGFSSENPHWGPVRNPWDPRTSPGGSSGGSGAAVAAGITPIALGTDTGGSVRVPAALCGTYGLKVTHGAVPLEGVFPLVPSIDTVGPLGDSMDAIASSYRVLSEDGRPMEPVGPARIGIPQPWYDEAPMAVEVDQAFARAVASLKDLGHEVHSIEMPDVRPSMEIVHAIAPEVREVHRPFRERGEEYGEEVAERLDHAEAVTDEEISDARAWQGLMRSRFADAFGTVDYLMTPTVPVRRKVIGEADIAGHHYRSVLSYFTSLVNHTLHPALAMPIAGEESPPASLQLIGPLTGDLRLIALGTILEREGIVAFRAAPGWKSDNTEA